jgi:hypothetical protein
MSALQRHWKLFAHLYIPHCGDSERHTLMFKREDRHICIISADLCSRTICSWSHQWIILVVNIEINDWFLSAQLLQYGLSEEKIRSDSWVAQDLCHRLDLALRHGLRRPTAGYWPYVRHFTHMDNVKMLEKSCSRRRATLDKSMNAVLFFVMKQN